MRKPLTNYQFKKWLKKHPVKPIPVKKYIIDFFVGEKTTKGDSN